MARDVVFMVATGTPAPEYCTYAINTWERWCAKNDVRLFVLRDVPEAYRDIPYILLRYYMLDILDDAGIDYRRVAHVDADIMVRWDAPTIFTADGFAAVRDLGDVHWIIRDLSLYERYFPGVAVDWYDYINAGFFVVDGTDPLHRTVLEEMQSFTQEHRPALEKLTVEQVITEQTILNFMLKKHEVPMTYLPLQYNLTKLRERNLLYKSLFIDHAYLWHFNSFTLEERTRLMRDTWQRTKRNYPPIRKVLVR